MTIVQSRESVRKRLVLYEYMIMKRFYYTLLYSLMFYSVFSYSTANKSVLQVNTEVLKSDSDTFQSVFERIGTNGFIKSVDNLLTNWDGTQFDECVNDTRLYLDSIRKGHQWAITMLDATGKMPSGILRGNQFEPGSYFECLSIDQRLPEREENLAGKYCLVTINLIEILRKKMTIPNNSDSYGDEMHILETLTNYNSPGDITIGFCIPSRCSRNQWKSVLSKSLQIDVKIYSKCRTINDKPWTRMDTAGVIMLALLGSLMALGTFIEIVYKGKGKSRTEKLLIQFSVMANSKRLFSLSTSTQPLDHLHGLRVFSMFWIIIRHQWCGTIVSNTSNFLDVKEPSTDLRNAWVYSMTFAVDTFFFLSGFLVTWNVLKKFYKEGGIGLFTKDLPSFYIKRYIRMVLPMGVLIVVFMGLLYRAFDGPLSNDTFPFNFGNGVAKCEENWWTNALLIHNFKNYADMCLFHTWFLAADFQMYLMASLLLLFMLKYNKYTKIVLPTLTVISTIGFFATCHVNRISIDPPYSGVEEYHKKPWTHLPVYLIGMTVAESIFKSKLKSVKFAKIVVLSGWVACLATIFTIVITRTLLSRTGEYSAWHAFHISFSRPAWAFSIAWIVFCCYHNIAGPIGFILNLKCWAILSRLSFAVYLVHIPVLILGQQSNPGSDYITEDGLIQHFFSTVCYSIIYATVLTLSAEIPMMGIMQIVFSKKGNVTAQVVASKCQPNENSDQENEKRFQLQSITKM